MIKNMTKSNEHLFSNSPMPLQIQSVLLRDNLTELTGAGGIGMSFNPSDIHVFQEGQPSSHKEPVHCQNSDRIWAEKWFASRKEKEQITTQRFRIARMVARQSKKEFTALAHAFEILAQTPTGRGTLVTIPESTSYALSKLSSMAQMCGNKRQIIFSNDESLYTKPLAETVDTIGHEYTHLINHQNIYRENFDETEADFFAVKMLDEISARMQASQMVHEARKEKLLPRKLGSCPLTVSQAWEETVACGYPDLFILAICEKRHISPFLLAQSEPVHSDYFRQKAVPYFLSAYPSLKEEALLGNIESLYKNSISKRAEELISMGCKIPPAMVAAFGRKGR